MTSDLAQTPQSFRRVAVSLPGRVEETSLRAISPGQEGTIASGKRETPLA